MEKVTVAPDGCWEWTGAINGKGYPHFYDGERVVVAHRWSYAEFVGELDPALTIDHLCKNTRCVNPSHLEQVSLAENIRRGKWRARCHLGHERRQQPSGRWTCPTCDAASSRRYIDRKRVTA